MPRQRAGKSLAAAVSPIFDYLKLLDRVIDPGARKMPMHGEIQFVRSALKPQDYPKPLAHEVVFVGRSNVGKSSLLNALFFNKQLARVSSSPGKTRLINFFSWRNCLFVDVPGYGFAKVSQQEREAWQEMMERYFRLKRPLRLVCVLLDSRHLVSELDESMIRYLQVRSLSYCVIFTKWDLLKQSDKAKQKQYFEQICMDMPRVYASAKDRSGIKEIWNLIHDYCAHAERPHR